MVEKNFSILEAYSFALHKFSRNWLLFIKVIILMAFFMALPWIITTLIFFLSKNQNILTEKNFDLQNIIPSSILTLTYITSYLISLWLSAGFTYCCLKLYDQDDIKAKSIFIPIILAFKFIITSFLAGLVIFLGFILLVIPGLFAASCYSFAPYVTLNLNYSSFNSLSHSRKITKHKRLKVLLFLFFELLLPMFIVGLALLIGSIFSSMPLMLLLILFSMGFITIISNLAMVYVYKELERQYTIEV